MCHGHAAIHVHIYSGFYLLLQIETNLWEENIHRNFVNFTTAEINKGYVTTD